MSTPTYDFIPPLPTLLSVLAAIRPRTLVSLQLAGLAGVEMIRGEATAYRGHRWRDPA